MASFVAGQDETTTTTTIYFSILIYLYVLQVMQRYDLLPKQATWHYLLARDYSVFPNHACSVKMARYWPRFSFYVFMDLDTVSVQKQARKGRRPGYQPY